MAKKSNKSDTIVKKVFSSIVKSLDGEEVEGHDNPTAKDILGAVANWGGKSKDELVQVLCREIGIATAAVLKEPLNQVLENRKLQISIEFVPKTDDHKKQTKKSAASSKKKKSSAAKKR